MTDKDDCELLAVYQDNIDKSADIETARENFCGKYNSEAAWAKSWLQETGELEQIPEHLRKYIDFESYARDHRVAGDVIFIWHNRDMWVFSTADH